MVNENKSALFKECLYMVLDSNNPWALAAEQWVCEGQASPALWAGELTTLLEVQRWDMVQIFKGC